MTRRQAGRNPAERRHSRKSCTLTTAALRLRGSERKACFPLFPLVKCFEVASELSVRESSTQDHPSVDERVGFWLAGFVAGEGCFTIVVMGEPGPKQRRRFVFSVGVASRDAAVLEQLRAFLGRGSIHHRGQRRPTWQPESTFAINSLLSHERATIPFMDRYLLPSHKRVQYDAWKTALRAYATERNVRWGRGRSICSVEGCDLVVRGRGVCRHHYYRLTGW